MLDIAAWTCTGCKHLAPLNEFYVVLEDETRDYRCPSCETMDNAKLRIPRIDLRDAKGNVVRKFYIPTPKQVAMHIDTHRNLLWGGRAGTGKSWALRHDAYMRALAVPGYRVLVLRRQVTELRDTHLDKCLNEVPALGGQWRASENTAVFTHPGGVQSRIRFGHCQTEADWQQYLSSEFDLIIYDEGSSFTDYMVGVVNSRLRTAKKGVIPFVRIGSNPGANWLYRYYISQDITPDENPAYDPADYHFIPATIEDNPHVNIKEQEMRLNGLPSEALRKMYRDGDWTAVEGQFFTEWRPRRYTADETVEDWHVITELPTIQGRPLDEVDWLKCVAVIDWGYDPDPGALIVYALMPSKRYIALAEMTFKRTIVPKVAEQAVEFVKKYHITQRIGGHDMWMNDKQVGESMAETFARRGFSMRPADTDRIQGWSRLHTLLTSTVYEGDREVPMFQVYGPGCPQLARSIPMLQADPKNHGDILEHDDHWADTARWFAMSRPTGSKETKVSAWSRFSPAVRKAMLGRRGGILGSEAVRHA